MTYILIGAIAVGIGGMLFAASLIFQGGEREAVEDRLASLTQNGGRGAAKAAADQPSLLRSPLDDAPNQLEEWLRKFFNLSKFLDQSGKDTTVSQFLAYPFGAGFVAAAICYVFSPWKSLVPVAFGLAAIMPLTYFWFIRKRRLDKFGAQLPQALDLMCQALRAGQSLPAGIQLVGNQIDHAIFGGGDGREGPRLKELAVTTSSYGQPLPRQFGRMRVGGTVIWATDIRESSTTEGGKGRPSTDRSRNPARKPAR